MQGLLAGSAESSVPPDVHLSHIPAPTCVFSLLCSDLCSSFPSQHPPSLECVLWPQRLGSGSQKQGDTEGAPIFTSMPSWPLGPCPAPRDPGEEAHKTPTVHRVPLAGVVTQGLGHC